jgi:hypothetical protein
LENFLLTLHCPAIFRGAPAKITFGVRSTSVAGFGESKSWQNCCKIHATLLKIANQTKVLA